MIVEFWRRRRFIDFLGLRVSFPLLALPFGGLDVGVAVVANGFEKTGSFRKSRTLRISNSTRGYSCQSVRGPCKETRDISTRTSIFEKGKEDRRARGPAKALVSSGMLNRSTTYLHRRFRIVS